MRWGCQVGMGGVRTVVLLVRLVGVAYSRQFAAGSDRVLVQIQFDCLVQHLFI